MLTVKNRAIKKIVYSVNISSVNAYINSIIIIIISTVSLEEFTFYKLQCLTFTQTSWNKLPGTAYLSI